MRCLKLSLIAYLFAAGGIGAAPFDQLPPFPCDVIARFELPQLNGSSGPEVFALWLHGYASGAVAAQPNAADEIVPALVTLRDMVVDACAENPDGEINAGVLNRMLEVID